MTTYDPASSEHEFTDCSGNQPWQGGADPEYLRELVTYWADGFDWRGREAELNAVAHYLTDIAKCRLHFVHVRAKRPAAATSWCRRCRASPTRALPDGPLTRAVMAEILHTL